MPIILICLLVTRAPLWWLIQLLRFLPAVAQRFAFERENVTDAQCQRFRKIGLSADLCVHFSSEGEFEQVKSLIEQCLNLGMLVELLFSSPSVEKKVKNFSSLYPDKVRYLRLPLLDFFPFLIGQNVLHWVSASKFMMVRYDFYPELLLLGLRSERFILYSASMRSKTQSGLLGYCKLMILNCFDDLFCATSKDYDFFKSRTLNTSIHPALDLRSLQISKRQAKFHTHDFYKELNFLLSVRPKEQRICLAQFWPNEASLFSDEFVCEITSGRKLVYLAPHKLGEDFYLEVIKEIKTQAPKLFIYRITEHLSLGEITSLMKCYQEKPGLIISSISNVLCDLYPYFPKVFVGGGHGKGIHSLLEPFMALADVFCGPNIWRSSEFDIITSLGGVVEYHEDLIKVAHQLLNADIKKQVDISDFLSQNKREMSKLLKIVER